LIGLILCLLGAAGVLLPIVGYFSYRYWLVSLYQLTPYLLFLFYGPLMLWFLVTGIGLLAKREWARSSVQTLSVFLILTGIILITALNTISVSGQFQLSWKQLKLAGTIGLFILLVVLPLFSLVLFAKKKEEEGIVTRSSRDDKPAGYHLN